jgi:hypothetical protein
MITRVEDKASKMITKALFGRVYNDTKLNNRFKANLYFC